MEIPRRTAMLGAVLAASLLGEAAAAAQPSKLDARLRARRAVSTTGGYAPAGAGGASGPSRSVLIRVSPGTPLSALRAAFPGASFGSQAGDVITARAGDAALDALALDPRVREIGAAVRARPLMDAVRSSSTSSGLALGTIYGSALTDLAGATGSGVVVGVVDTGIDYTHRDFLIDNTYPGTSTSRILALWDQTISTHDATGGPFPSGWDYGVEYTNAQLTAKVRTGAGTINTSDTDGHGTHVASIAAGDGTGTNGAIPSGTFQGVSPSADLIVVRTTFSTADVVDGVNFIVARAAAAGKRAPLSEHFVLRLTDVYGTDLREDEQLDGVHGILVPGGFGDRGIEGKIRVAQLAREKKIEVARMPEDALLVVMCVFVVIFSHISSILL